MVDHKVGTFDLVVLEVTLQTFELYSPKMACSSFPVSDYVRPCHFEILTWYVVNEEV